MTPTQLRALTEAHRRGGLWLDVLAPEGRGWYGHPDGRRFTARTVDALVDAGLLAHGEVSATGFATVRPTVTVRRIGNDRRWRALIPRPAGNDVRVARAIIHGAQLGTLDDRFASGPAPRVVVEVSTDASVMWREAPLAE